MNIKKGFLEISEDVMELLVGLPSSGFYARDKQQALSVNERGFVIIP